MNRITRRWPSPAMAVAFVALIAAISGSAVALPGKNKVEGNDIKKNAIGGGKIKDNSVKGADVDEGSLGKVPSAGSADSAANAANATNAGTAANANALGGLPAVQFPSGVTYAFDTETQVASTDPNERAQASAECPAGTAAIGGGAVIVPNTAANTADQNTDIRREVVLTSSNPILDGARWVATAAETDSVSGEWSVTATAICATIPNPSP